jgi:transposase-like protein
MLSVPLPNHLKASYKEMRAIVEEKVFQFDLKRWLKGVYCDSVEVEFEQFIDLDRYERHPDRKDYRNGFYERSLDTVYGFIDGIKVPRTRHSCFQPTVFERYQRREKAINKLIVECYWRGISTRDVDAILRALCGVNVSASTVSRLTGEWQQEVFRWHQRQISDEYDYLFLDGVWIKNRSLGKKRRLVLVAFGIKKDGTKEVIDYMLSQTEKEEHWQKFLNFLRHRGLEGKNLKLIATDGCHGLWNAIDMVFPGIPHQVCWAHKMRNILDKVKEADKEQVHKGLAKIFDKSVRTKKQALAIVVEWKRAWRKRYPTAVTSLEAAEERLFTYFDCPVEHHKAIRTTNHIERVFKEFRRRMRPQEITPNVHSADRILFALVQIRNEKLRRCALQFTQN